MLILCAERIVLFQSPEPGRWFFVFIDRKDDILFENFAINTLDKAQKLEIAILDEAGLMKILEKT